jgi:3-methyladenine DNA glycosylase AlkD
MKGKFPFLGVPSAARRAAAKEALTGFDPPTEAELAEVLRAMWAEPEREFQYVGCDWSRRHIGRCGPTYLAVLEQAITTKSWWDTVDALAGSSVGPLVAAHPDLRAEMDRWLEADDLWLRRSALLHQLLWKQRMDIDWIEAACLARADEQDFFIRKAIGWILRQVSKQDEARVRGFVAEHGDVLSGLSQREALMWLTRRDRRLAR